MVSKLLVIVGRVKQADAFVVITPEDNHSIPAVLKNAIDTVWLSFGFRNKPVAAVGYSGSVGAGDLAWWSAALETARAAGQLTPGTLRVRAALAAAQA